MDQDMTKFSTTKIQNGAVLYSHQGKNSQLQGLCLGTCTLDLPGQAGEPDKRDQDRLCD